MPDQTPRAEQSIKFGIDQAAGPTPPYIKTFYRVLLFASTLWATIVQPQFPHIPPDVVAEINKWLLIGNSLVYFICQFFGYHQPGETQTAKQDATPNP